MSAPVLQSNPGSAAPDLRAPVAAPDLNENKASQNTRTRTWSYALLGLILFFTLDSGCRLFLKLNPYSQPNQTWVWWAVKALREAGRPDVAICGSSLMVATVVDTDATFRNSLLGQVVHHRSDYLSHLLEQREGKPVSTISLAIGGEMITDVLALSTLLLSDEHRPQTIVWGIAPRDFIDSTLGHPNHSEVVRYVNRLAGHKDVLGLGKKPFEKFDDFLCNVVFLYGHREPFIAVQQDAAHLLLTHCGINGVNIEKIPECLRSIFILNCPENANPYEWKVTPYAKVPWKDNSQEYLSRYNPFHEDVLKTQMQAYERMLAACHDKHVQVLLFNMPLMQLNMDLIPPGVYDRYLAETSALAKKYGVQYVDLNKEGLFPSESFADTCHMNGRGGMQFWNMVVQHWPESAI